MRDELCVGLGLAGAVAAGRGRARERPRYLAGRGRRADADAQRPSRHVVLGPGAVARWDSGLPAAGIRAGRTHLRPRDLEHEGRARLLRGGRAVAAGCGRPAARATSSSRPLRARSRRRSRATLRAPSTAATPPARAISSGTAVPRTCAFSASRPRTSSCSRTSGRSGCASPRTGRSSTRRSAPVGWRRTRSCACAACSTPCSSGCRRWEEEMSYDGVGGRRERRRDPGRVRLARLADAARDRSLRRPARAARRCRWRRRAGRRSSSRARLDGVEAEVYVTAPGAEIEEGHPLVAALGNAHAEVFGAPAERDVTRWFSDASVLTPLRRSRPSTTARRAGCRTPSWARTWRSRAS